jgi:hypothetical protein
MKKQIEKLVSEFVNNLLGIVRQVPTGQLGEVVTAPKKRGLGALPFEQQSIIAKKAAATRKHRAAGVKAAATRKNAAG